MRRSPLAGIDAGVYLRAIPLLARNPSIAVVPLLASVVSVLFLQIFGRYNGGLTGAATGGLIGLIVLLIQLFGLGAACIVADDAWRHGRASFDRAWDEVKRKRSDILLAAVAYSLLLAVAQYAGVLVGGIVAIVLIALVAFFLIWTLPAAAVGGIPGGAAIQVSIDRVRAQPAAAVLVAIVSLAAYYLIAQRLAFAVEELLLPYVAGTPILGNLIEAVFAAIAFAYIALVITKTYTDGAFGRRW